MLTQASRHSDNPLMGISTAANRGVTQPARAAAIAPAL
jgi:hypothetical protein